MSRRQRRVRYAAARLKGAHAKVLRRRARSSGPRAAATATVTALAMAGLGVSTATASPPSTVETVDDSLRDVANSRRSMATSPSRPLDLVNVAGTVFFTANDGRHGRELWRSDGTRAGTVLVKDINPGRDNSRPFGLTVVGERVFFSANDGRHGRELWRSDGTRTGTVLVKAIDPRPDYGPGDLTVAQGTLFFTADDDVHGTELWKSDGTTTGTVMVKDITPRAYEDYGSYGPSSLTDVGGTLFFTAVSGTRGRELWKSDGTTGGTALVKDITPGGYGYGSPFRLTDVAGTLFFSVDDGAHGPALWKSDGTRAGTVLVKDVDPTSYETYFTGMTAVGGTLFFAADDGIHGRELWKSDGTSAGTILVKDIQPGENWGDPFRLGARSSFAGVDNRLFFTADDGTRGRELWRSDGTRAGTVVVRDVRPGGDGSHPSSLAGVGRRLFFTSRDGTHGRELWSSDGTGQGTFLVKDITPGVGRNGRFAPSTLTDVEGTLFFAADDGSRGKELWTSDGTAAGTVLVKDINAATG